MREKCDQEVEKPITTTCKVCSVMIVLEKKYGWTEKDRGRCDIFCDSCYTTEEYCD